MYDEHYNFSGFYGGRVPDNFYEGCDGYYTNVL